MEGKRTASGALAIKRGNKWVIQNCVHSFIICADGCPYFEEPRKIDDLTKIGLCHGSLVFESFDDERPPKES